MRAESVLMNKLETSQNSIVRLVGAPDASQDSRRQTLFKWKTNIFVTRVQRKQKKANALWTDWLTNQINLSFCHCLTLSNTVLGCLTLTNLYWDFEG